jgi:hypothetical protein
MRIPSDVNHEYSSVEVGLLTVNVQLLGNLLGPFV